MQLVVGAAAIGVAGLLVQIPLQAAIATETGWRALRSPSRWIDVLSNSGLRWATSLGVRGRGDRRRRGARPRLRARAGLGTWAGLAGASIAFVSFSLTGHTRVTTPGWLVIPADAVHVAAAGIWFGGLVLLVLAWTARRRDGDPVAAGAARRSLLADGGRHDRRGRGERRDPRLEGSRLAAGADLDALRIHLGREAVRRRVRRRRSRRTTIGELVPDIRRTGKRVVTADGVPAATTEASVGGPGAAKTTRSTLAWRRLETTVRSEIVGLVVVLAITSALVAITPAREAASSGGVFSSTVAFRGGTLSLVVDPAKVGLNEIHVYVLDERAAARRRPRADDVADVAAVAKRRPARAGDGRRRARALVARHLRPHHPGRCGSSPRSGRCRSSKTSR